MPRHLRVQYPGALYHIYVRGNARQQIFLDDRDRERFIDRLANSVESYEVRLYLYCLMPNHYHLVAETPKANVSRFMQSVETGHTVYFNLRHDRSGHLSQGRFGGKLVEGDRYLLALSRYLHLNPVRTKRFERARTDVKRRALQTYRWSSYRSYVGLCREQDFVDYPPLRSLTGGRGLRGRQKAFQKFVEAGLSMDDQELRELLSESPRAIGSEEFLLRVDKLYQEQLKESEKPEDISFRKALVHLQPDEILRAVCEELGCGLEDLRARKRRGFEKALAARMLWRYSGLTKRGLARQIGLGSGAAVAWQLKKLDEELAAENVTSRLLRRQVRRMIRRLDSARSAANTN